jgi:hypothetical protein
VLCDAKAPVPCRLVSAVPLSARHPDGGPLCTDATRGNMSKARIIAHVQHSSNRPLFSLCTERQHASRRQMQLQGNHHHPVRPSGHQSAASARERCRHAACTMSDLQDRQAIIAAPFDRHYGDT